MKWTSIITRSHYWTIEKNMDFLGSLLRYARRIPSVVACFWGA